MSTIAKVFTVLNLVFSLFMVGTVASILSKSEDYKAKFESEQTAHKSDVDAKQIEVDKANTERANFEATNRTLTNTNTDLRAQLSAANSTVEQSRNDNNQLRNSTDAIQASLKSVETQLSDVETRNKDLMAANEKYRADAATADKDKLDAQDDRARLEGDLKRANDDGAEKEMQIAKLNDQLGNLRAEQDALEAMGVEIKKLVGNAIPKIDGQVSDVGSTFVILSVGEQDGVRIGFPFDVYRKGDYIGRVVVDEVHPDTSTARVTIKNQRGLPFERSDSATTRL